MKTLSEQINDIVKSSASVTIKRMQLAELGLTSTDVNVLIQASQHEAHAAARARRAAEALVNSLTFGVEIECYNAPREILLNNARNLGLTMNFMGYTHQDSHSAYKLVTDSSISGNDPIECVTPILQGTRGFNSLKACCGALKATGAKVNRSTGLHVHVGGVTTETQYVNVFKNYQLLEALIDTFMANSRRNSQWARTLSGRDFSDCRSIASVERVLNYDRYFKVNPCSWTRHHTIEFRQHQGSTDFQKIKMWARFCIKLVAWSASNVLTERPSSIDEIPFLDAAEKRFFNARANEFASVAA